MSWFYVIFFFLSMEAGNKIGLKSERKVSVGAIMTVHIAGLSEFQDIWLWKLNCIWAHCVNHVMPKRYFVFWREFITSRHWPKKKKKNYVIDRSGTKVKSKYFFPMKRYKWLLTFGDDGCFPGCVQICSSKTV